MPSDLGAVGGFHLEGRPAIDDVFGDAADYRRTIDRFIDLSAQMSTLRDQFAGTVQTALTELGVRGAKPSTPQRRGCPVDAVAGSYAKANRLGGDYLHLGRELTRHYEQIREFDRLGESVALTPDYRAKVRRVLAQYRVLVTDYREMKVAFHDQLIDELRYQGCDLAALLAKGEPNTKRAVAPDETWPAPGTPGSAGHAARPRARAAEREGAAPSNLPSEKVALNRDPPAEALDPSRRPRLAPGILFYRRQHEVQARLDRLPRRSEPRQSAERHALRLPIGGRSTRPLPARQRRAQVRRDPGTVRRGYLHEGWTITLRCD